MKLFMALSFLWLAGCTNQELYGQGQVWQTSQCLKLSEPIERQNCLQYAKMPYDQYKKDNGLK